MAILTDRSARALKPQDRMYRTTDGGGLVLETWPHGTKYWRFRYRFAGKEKSLGMGAFPEVSIREARDGLVGARALLRQGIDPSKQRKDARREALSAHDRVFEIVSADWLAENKGRWAPETYRKAKYVLETYLQPPLKNCDVATLATPEARRVIAAVSAKAPALAQKARGHLGAIMEFAVHKGLREEGRALSLRGSVQKKETGHIPAAVDPDDIRVVVSAVFAYESPITRAALILAMLTAQRPGTIAGGRWSEFDLDAAEWHIPGERMKMRAPHVVPLPRQAIEQLKFMRQFTADREYVFPPLARQRTPHLHRDALSSALRRMGLQGQHAAHGFRAMFRTAGRERLRIDADVLEAQLAHVKKGDVRKAYDRTQFLDERRVAMQAWADWVIGVMA
ncbi:tyrosine-type recombinase/integrase [Solilutibacter silvestris]|uniref:Integrase n=1 Tax=Solilutibacter silvestris TaxID=1645665 RepID=A0A2K1Q3F9_9GAMM|nr:integrase arm-type DNA-binding domain-containing protein [Lysobacter silvestris]PNS09586.1 hypothetical protein Lysil_1215 [Lysobacter silvestris]